MSEAVKLLLLRAAEANRSGNNAVAASHAEEALKTDPGNSEALLISGIAYTKSGNFEEAIARLQKVSGQGANSFAAAYWLSVACRKLGRPEEAVEYAKLACSLDPLAPMACEQLGYCLLDLLRFTDAESCFRKALTMLPNRAALHGGLAFALRGQGRTHDSVLAFRRATEIEPNSITARLHLVTALIDDGDTRLGADAARLALQIRPESALVRRALVVALLADNQPQEAEKHLQTLMQTEHTDADLFALSGRIKSVLGRREESRADYERAIELDPAHGPAYIGVTWGSRITVDERYLIDRMDAALSGEDLAPETGADLHYALGKVHDDLGQYAEALHHFDQANHLTRRIRFGDTAFNSQVQHDNNGVVLSVFTPEFMDRYRGAGSADPLPIFVVGMMRSGTTLVEQILSSHPRIGGAGERSFWAKHQPGTLLRPGPAIDPNELKSLGDEFCSLLRSLAPGRDHVVDKMPGNYNALPLIHLAHPNARIIHVCRDPVDTCLSIYFTPNATRIEWANDRDNIVFAYEEYLRLMAGWRTVIPPDRLMEVQYENLVSNTERVAREMIAFCDLEWDDACLHPEENMRHVLTPSRWQVKQPIYKTSLERWKNYEPWLGPFKRLHSASPS